MTTGARWLVPWLALAFVCACAPGPKRILGTISGVDGGESAASGNLEDGSVFTRVDGPGFRPPPAGWPTAPLDAGIDAFVYAPFCFSDDDCAFQGLYCDVERGLCVDCTRDAHCGNARPYCQQGWNICVECETNSDCLGGYCDLRYGICQSGDGSGAGP